MVNFRDAMVCLYEWNWAAIKKLVSNTVWSHNPNKVNISWASQFV